MFFLYNCSFLGKRTAYSHHFQMPLRTCTVGARTAENGRPLRFF
ncbi:hypothetical protein BRO54_1780 [Geobacillus proteiniphilus]|uniref:Uncharacterized protein n=1 Tax=Geobacillus proteiniphilus TaxID=860353 RepID=A0A1Q5T180_9BACL|nr:hypothetical protein BRO54_1780 [Geobacillus proteiniphilus]